MMKRIVLALLLIWPLEAHALELPGRLSGQPPKAFMNRWIEAPFEALEEEYVFSLRQLDRLLRERFNASIKYREGGEGLWLMDAAWVQKENRGLQVVEKNNLLSVAFGPGKFEDTMQVKDMMMNGERFTAMWALQVITAWGKTIHNLHIE